MVVPLIIILIIVLYDKCKTANRSIQENTLSKRGGVTYVLPHTQTTLPNTTAIDEIISKYINKQNICQ